MDRTEEPSRPDIRAVLGVVCQDLADVRVVDCGRPWPCDAQGSWAIQVLIPTYDTTHSVSDANYVTPMLLPHGGWPMAAGPASRLGSPSPGIKQGCGSKHTLHLARTIIDERPRRGAARPRRAHTFGVRLPVMVHGGAVPSPRTCDVTDFNTYPAPVGRSRAFPVHAPETAASQVRSHAAADCWFLTYSRCRTEQMRLSDLFRSR